jgi:hypothetical protein
LNLADTLNSVKINLQQALDALTQSM